MAWNGGTHGIEVRVVGAAQMRIRPTLSRDVRALTVSNSREQSYVSVPTTKDKETAAISLE